jgi:hypothetical protein
VTCSTLRAGSVEDRQSIGRGPGTQRENPKMRGIAGHIEQAERGAIRKSPQALFPTSTHSNGFCIIRVWISSSSSSSSASIRRALGRPASSISPISRCLRERGNSGWREHPRAAKQINPDHISDSGRRMAHRGGGALRELSVRPLPPLNRKTERGFIVIRSNYLAILKSGAAKWHGAAM